MRGLLDSDGCVGSKNRHYITTTSHGMARDILSLLRSLGVSGSIHRREPAAGGIIKGRQIEGNRPSYQVHYSSYALAGENSGVYGVRQRFSHEDKDFNEVRLRDIKDSKPCSDFVYDFEMEGHPSFVANGILVHNSATAYREDNQEIRMEGAMGRKLIEISASDLTDLGYLVPARVFMIRIEHIESTDDYREVYDKHIKHCWERNFRIKQAAEAFHEAGRPTLILVEHVEHGQILESMIKDSVFVAGSDKGEKDGWEDEPDVEKDYRRRMLNDCESGKIILIATSWAYTGVDAPAISTLVLAGTNKSAVTTYQQVGRVLRPLGKDVAESEVNGKAEAIIVDFMDNQEDLHKHSVRRKKVYQQERAWTVKVVN